jgi:hypothetical protein
MNKATATSHGKSCLEASEGGDEDGEVIDGAFGIVDMRRAYPKHHHGCGSPFWSERMNAKL